MRCGRRARVETTERRATTLNWSFEKNGYMGSSGLMVAASLGIPILHFCTSASSLFLI